MTKQLKIQDNTKVKVLKPAENPVEGISQPESLTKDSVNALYYQLRDGKTI